MKRIISAIIGLALCAQALAVIIVNPWFDDGLTGWDTTVHGPWPAAVQADYPPQFNPWGPAGMIRNGTLSQPILFPSGLTTLRWEAYSEVYGEWHVTINGVPVETHVVTSPFEWRTYTYTVNLRTGGLYDFGWDAPNSGFLVVDSLRDYLGDPGGTQGGPPDPNIPEPGYFALVAGIGLIGFCAHRRMRA